jgi:hypothetical protein
MHSYIFLGKVLPERAQLSVEFPPFLGRSASGEKSILRVNIILNQIVIYLDSDDEDLMTMRNWLFDFISGQLAVFGFTHGYAYQYRDH